MAILVVFLFDLRSFAGFLTVHIPVWAGLARAARRFLACRRRSGGAGRRIFFGLHGIAGRDGIGSRSSPFPCLPGVIRRYGDPAERRGHLFSDCAASLAGRDWLARLAFPLPAGGVPARAGNRRTATFLFCRATLS